MRPEAGRDRTPTTAKHRAGFALIAALVVLVLLASIGSVMLRVTGVQQAGSTVALLGTRASFAARSGVEWGIRTATTTGDCPAASTTLSLSEGAVSGFTVVVTCTSSTHREGGRTRTQILLRAVAQFGTVGSRDHALREVGASLVL